MVDRMQIQDFKFGDLLIKGELSDTYAGTHTPSNTPVFIILVDKRNAEQSVDYERFDSLQELVKTLSHPNLLQYHNVFQNETHIAVITEYLAGQNFREYLVKQPEKRISEPEARNFFKQILSVIDYLLKHNIIHRNINLRNIFIDRNQLKIGDFLVTNKIKPIYKPHSDTSAYHFYAPECWLDEGQTIDVSSDIWALGVILYAMTCGCYPFMGKHELDIFLNVKRGRFAIPKYLSEELASLIRLMLNPNPSERPTLNYILNHSWITGRTPTPSLINVVNMYNNNKEDFESFAASLENNEMPFSPNAITSPASAGTSPIISSVADLSLDSHYFVPIDNYSPNSNSNLTVPNPISNLNRTPSPTSDPNFNVRKRSVSMLQDVYQIQKTYSDPNISVSNYTNVGASPALSRSYSNSNHKSLDLATETPLSEEIILKLMNEEDIDVGTENKALSRVASQGRQRANSTIHAPSRRLGTNTSYSSSLTGTSLAPGRQSRRRSNSTNTTPSSSNRSNIPGFDKIFLPQTAEMNTPPTTTPYSPSNLRNSAPSSGQPANYPTRIRSSSPTNTTSPSYSTNGPMSQYQSKFQTRSASPSTVQIQNLTSQMTQQPTNSPVPTPTSPSQQNVNIHNYQVQGFPTNSYSNIIPTSPYQVYAIPNGQFPQQGNAVPMDPQMQAQLRAYIQAQVHAANNNGVQLDPSKLYNPMIQQQPQSNGIIGQPGFNGYNVPSVNMSMGQQYYPNPNSMQYAQYVQQQQLAGPQYTTNAGPPEVVPFQISLTENPEFNLSEMPNLDDWIESVLKGQV